MRKNIKSRVWVKGVPVSNEPPPLTNDWRPERPTEVSVTTWIPTTSRSTLARHCTCLPTISINLLSFHLIRGERDTTKDSLITQDSCERNLASYFIEINLQATAIYQKCRTYTQEKVLRQDYDSCYLFLIHDVIVRTIRKHKSIDTLTEDRSCQKVTGLAKAFTVIGPMGDVDEVSAEEQSATFCSSDQLA